MESLVGRAEAILYLSPTRSPFRPALREAIWSSTGRFRGPVEMAPNHAVPKGTPGEGASNEITEDSIAFLYRARIGARVSSKMYGGSVCIVLHSNRSECVERSPLAGHPTALVVENSVYFALPFKRKHENYVTYSELKSAILSIVHRMKPGSRNCQRGPRTVDLRIIGVASRHIRWIYRPLLGAHQGR